jgi:hypothetical protein
MVLTHEAGHAVAALAIHDTAEDILVKETGAGPERFIGLQRPVFDFFDLTSGKVDPVNAVIVIAAGAKAEEVCLGIRESAGFAGDRTKIKEIRKMWEQKCSQDSNPEHLQTLEAIGREIDLEFPRCVDVIRKHRESVERIAAAAHAALQSIGEQNLTDRQILLPGARIRELWRNNPSCNI